MSYCTALMPAVRITFSHFVHSCSIQRANSSGVEPTVSTPWLARRSRIAGFATAKACANPAIRDRLASQGVETVGSTPEEFARWLEEEWTKWEKVIRTAGIKAVE